MNLAKSNIALELKFVEIFLDSKGQGFAAVFGENKAKQVLIYRMN
ncbi:hypothetical protein C7S15_3210 [Burkholderia cepacia]|nr:hypothetical protein [Burkholderia cepacia]